MIDPEFIPADDFDDPEALDFSDPDDDFYDLGTPHDQRVTLDGEVFYDEDYDR